MNNASKLFLFFFVLFLMTGCTQEKTTNEQSNKNLYSEFTKQVYRSYIGVPTDVVMNECIFDGFILAIVEINQQGKATFELVYASSEFFKEVFFEPLKTVDTSSLKKGKRYLVPISYKVTRNSSFSKVCGQGKLKHTRPHIGKEANNIYYVFKPFEFFWVTPVS